MSQTPRTGFAYLDTILEPPGSRLAMAHRGGAGHPEVDGIENTLEAFEHAVALGYSYLETDVHVSADGELFAFHDDSLDRVTGTPGRILDLTGEAIRAAKVGGRCDIPTLDMLMDAFPEARFNIDIKADGAVGPLVQLIEYRAAHDRVCIGSFSSKRLRHFRKQTGGRVATSAGPAEVTAFLSGPTAWAFRTVRRGAFQAFQVPVQMRGVRIVTRSFVRRAHLAGAHVHVWTVDDPVEMEQLLDLGVDGLITDRTDVLKNVLSQRGLWKDHQ